MPPPKTSYRPSCGAIARAPLGQQRRRQAERGAQHVSFDEEAYRIVFSDSLEVAEAISGPRTQVEAELARIRQQDPLRASRLEVVAAFEAA